MPDIQQYIHVTKEMLGYLGNQPTNPPGINQGQEGFGLHAPDVVDLGTARGLGSDYYRLGGWQLGNSEQFGNGQWWQLEAYIGSGDPREDDDPANWQMVYSQLTPKNDLVTNLGMGDDYIVFEQGGQHIILDLAAPFSSEPTTRTYGPETDVNNQGVPTFQEADDAFDQAFCFVRGTLIATP